MFSNFFLTRKKRGKRKKEIIRKKKEASAKVKISRIMNNRIVGKDFLTWRKRREIGEERERREERI